MHTRQRYVAGFLAATAALFLIALNENVIGWSLLITSVIIGLNAPKAFWREFLIIVGAIGVLALAPVSTDISPGHFVSLAGPMLALVAVPYLLYRYVFKNPAISFSLRQGAGKRYWQYFGLFMVLGYLVLPYYIIGSGVYEGWPAADDTSSFIRLFIGTNMLGAWDEFFFICTLLIMFRRLYTRWVAIAFTSIIMVSFLYELGFRSYGPPLLALFAISQCHLYLKTKSLRLVLSLHLGLDLILFLVLVHAPQPERFDWFITTALLR